ncbi:hypothetical protein MPSEU_000643500 [Mayamaea pseudoterrestris]|nr:hypothetical protein MPSEU_000643500 [Mayamaea pseudoterrestris]
MTTVAKSISPILTRLRADEGQVVASVDSGSGHPNDEQISVLPMYRLRPKAKLWQLNEMDPSLFWKFVQGPGFALQISKTLCAILCNYDHTPCLKHRNGEEYTDIGPQLSSAADGRREKLRAKITCFVLPSSLSKEELLQVKRDYEVLLRFVTGWPMLGSQPLERNIFIEINPDFDYADDLEDIFSAECVQTCFAQQGWDETANLRLAEFHPSQAMWTALANHPFNDLTLLGYITIPRSFLRQHRCASLTVHCQPSPEEAPEACAAGIAPIHIDADSDTFWTPQDADDFLHTWLTASSNLLIHDARFKEESWNRFWQSPILLNNTTCASLTFVESIIHDKDLSHEHFGVIPKSTWIVEWLSNERTRSKGTLRVRRNLAALSQSSMAYFRPEQNPLLGDKPPLDARQSVILEALLRAANDPTHVFNLSKVYAPVLLAPRTSEACVHDTETSLVELRALGIDHQTTIEMLVQANNTLQEQRARDNQEMRDIVRRMEEEKRLRQQETQRLESRLRALESENRLLRSKARDGG